MRTGGPPSPRLTRRGGGKGSAGGAVPSAVATLRAQGKPWVLDPVFVDASPTRLDLARLCVAGGPCVVRCNGPEFAALAGEAPTAETVMAYAAARRTVVALTGPV